MTPELLERLRHVGLRLDREGRLWHQDEEVTHAGLYRAILSWLDRAEDGRDIVRLDERRFAYVDVEDAHLLARAARWQGERLLLSLNDGSEEELDYASTRIGAGNAVYCTVHGKLTARLTTPAYYVLAERIEEREDGFVLRAAGGAYPLRGRSCQTD